MSRTTLIIIIVIALILVIVFWKNIKNIISPSSIIGATSVPTSTSTVTSTSSATSTSTSTATNSPQFPGGFLWSATDNKCYGLQNVGDTTGAWISSDNCGH